MTFVRRIYLILAFDLVLTIIGVGCSKPSTPADHVDAGIAAVEATCSFLEGFTENKTVISVCATLEEIGFIADTILSLFPASRERKSSAAPDGGATCALLSGTTVCATRAEVGAGIKALVQKRRALLLERDGGSP